MKILLLAPRGFEIFEFSALFDVFGWANNMGYGIKVVTCGLKKQVASAFGAVFTVDFIMDGINLEDYEALAITGGLVVPYNLYL